MKLISSCPSVKGMKTNYICCNVCILYASPSGLCFGMHFYRSHIFRKKLMRYSKNRPLHSYVRITHQKRMEHLAKLDINIL